MSLQSCPTLCDPRDGSPPGSLVPGILQARTLEWVAISFSKHAATNGIILSFFKYYFLHLILYFIYSLYFILFIHHKDRYIKNHGLGWGTHVNTSDLTLGINWPPVRQDEKCRTNQKYFIHTHHQIL